MQKQYTKYFQTVEDPIVNAKHNGRFQLFFSQQVPIPEIKPAYTISTLVQEINTNLDFFGLEAFEYTDHRRPTVDIAQFVKINKLYHSLKNKSNIKPWLLYASEQGMSAICGDSRKRAIELLPEITHVNAFISVPANLQQEYHHWIRVDDFDQFATLIGCQPGTPFWFTVSDQFGLDWYEVAMDHDTGTTGPVFRNHCIDAIKNYIKTQPSNFRFCIEWFKQEIDWHQYVLE